MDIDPVKENIQPLRGGRNPVQLDAALQPDAQGSLQAQRREREAAVQAYAGPDPLEPWFELVQWVEQSYPKRGHEGQISQLIKDCLARFENDERYSQDRRYLRLWIKFIDSSNNPLELYQLLYNRGIGTACSELYRAWAMYCEEADDFPKAETVYNLGLQAKAQPENELQQAHMAFQICFAQRMLHDDSPTKRKAASALAETRLALTSLRAVKRRNVITAPTQRTGDAVHRNAPGTLRQNPDAAAQPRSNIMINVYNDNPGPSSFPTGYDAHAEEVASAEPPVSLLQSCNSENEKEVGIWTSLKTEKLNVAKIGSVSAPAFPLYEDDNLRLSANHLPYCLDDLSTFKVPMCYPDPLDPNKIPMYNKKEVYKEEENGNVKEFSLEQIRARKYKTVKKEENKYIEEGPASVNSEFNLEKVMTQTDSLLNTEDTNTLIVLQDCDNNYVASDVKQIDNEENLENKVNHRTSNENYVPVSTIEDYKTALKEKIVVDFDRSLMANLNNDSMTVNTKAAYQTLNLFNESDVSVPLVNRMEPNQIEIPEDNNSITIASVKTSKPPDFVLYEQTIDDIKNPGQMFNLDDDTSTQIFSFNVPSASTPCINNFKKPQNLKDSVRSFSLADCPDATDKILTASKNGASQGTTNETRAQEGLYPIMETTQEYRSGSSSSGSNFTTRNTLYGYTGRENTMPSNVMSEKTQDSNVNQESSYQYGEANVYGKKPFNQKVTPLNNAQRNINYPNVNENVVHPSGSPLNQNHTLDHQYHKLPNANYNRYSTQRGMSQYFQTPGQTLNSAYQHVGYQNVSQNSNYEYQTGVHQNSVPVYPNAGYQSPQQSMQSPNSHALFQSPPHVPQGYQSPQQTMIQHGFQSPQQMSQHGYSSPNVSQHGFQSPQSNLSQHGFQSPQQDYINQSPVPQHVYVNSQQNYASPQYYPEAQQSYHNQQTHNQVNNVVPVAYQNPVHTTPAYSNAHHSYNSNTSSQHYANVQTPQMYPQNNSYNANQPSQLINNSYQGIENYQTTNHSHYGHYAVQNDNHHAKIQSNASYSYHNSHSTPNHQYSHLNMSHDSASNSQTPIHNLHMKHNMSQNHVMHNNSHQYIQNNVDPNKHVHQSPTSKLRSVRHEVPHHMNTKPNNFSNPDLSHHYGNFVSPYNQPKDNANTPKFTNSPSISQKMHKNLYVSSPEQGQIPPNSDLPHLDISNEGALRMLLQSNIVMSSDKSRDISKRQLDFEQRSGPPSEDSRDSFGKAKQKSYRDSLQMDVDSENSMDCQNLTFKSNCSNSMIATEDIARPATIEFPNIIDPFNLDLCNSLLQYIKFPNKNHYMGYYELKSIPKLQQGTNINVDQQKFTVEKQLGKGTFGCVFRGYDVNNQEPVALKFQKPGHPWEYYICQEIKARIKDPFMLPGYMDIRFGFFSDSASVFVSELSVYGSLLDVANRLKAATTKCIGEFIVMLLASEMLSIIHHLHKSDIIHADIKPDNFLVMKIPQTESRAPSLQLIDFGCAIDMSLFPKETTFKKVISTDGFTCTEMRDGRPWTYQTDLYCLAGTVYVILMGSYMQTARRRGQWVVEKKWPRYMKSAVWDKVFTTLLNVEDCNTIPNLLEIKETLDEFLRSEDAGLLATQLRNFEHVLKCK